MTDNMIQNMTIAANADAFAAYNILFYDFAPKDGAIQELNDAFTLSESGIAMAATVEANLAETPYVLSERSRALLALYYSAQLTRLGEDLLFVDPARDIMSFMPDFEGKPFYPDFPTQVLEMDEADFRRDQIIHYWSTYGVELIAALMGADVEVQEGWKPQGGTEKTQSDSQQIEKHVVEIVFGAEAMRNIVRPDLARPSRMSAPACRLCVFLFENGAALPDIAFHENMMEIIAAAAAKNNSYVLYTTIHHTVAHPGDIFKAIIWLREEHGIRHLSTAQKKGFCLALENYSALSIARKLADLSKRGEIAASMLSIQRFGKNNLVEAKRLVDEKEVVSFNAQVERAWKRYEEHENGAQSALLDVYSQKPGVMLRSVVRLASHGVDISSIESCLKEHVGELSLTTLVTLATKFAAKNQSQNASWRTGVSTEDISDQWKAFAPALLNLTALRMEQLDTPLKSKKVYIPKSPFSSVGSVIMPNATSTTSNAYPPVGMAYDIPDDKTVRFFTFWDDRERRVDVDLHFHGSYANGNRIHIGWNSRYKEAGMCTSGDITDSHNSAEYLDIDMREALLAGVKDVHHVAHIYSGRKNWCDIQQCFSGALVVGNTEPNTALYNSNNVLFHDEMTGKGYTEHEYAYINVPDHYVRILRGAELGFTETAFNLSAYLMLLLAAQNAEQVDNVEDADIVVTIGRDDTDYGKETYCLIDESFFIA